MTLLDPFLTEAMRRLDAWLLTVCDIEERRAVLLAGDGGSGWDGVRNLVRLPTESLLEPLSPPDLLPGGGHPINRIAAALQLQACEAEALLVLLAAYLEPRYQSLYAVLQDNIHQTRPTERLLLTILGQQGERRQTLISSLRSGGRLMRSGLVVADEGDHPPMARPLGLADDLVSLLLGREFPIIDGALWQQRPHTTANSAAAFTALPSWQVIHGSGDRAGYARSLAGVDIPILELGIPGDLVKAKNACACAWRLALAVDCLPLLDLRAVEEQDLAALGFMIDALLRELGGRAWLLSEQALPLAVPHLECRPASWTQRRELWLAEANRRGANLAPASMDRLAARFRLPPADIRAVFENARSHDEADLDHSASHLGRSTIRHSLRTPSRRDFNDMVLRDTTRESLERLVYFAVNRDRIAESRGLQRRYQLQWGPIALFSGRSGTGKTLAAEAVAGALGRPLYTVDLARLVSKYIGDTEKHVDEVLSQGERASAVLFFDEADVLFSGRMEKTSNSSERFANMMVGYLLQRIERHDGLVILATNLRHALDEAFLRRFQFRVEFPLPEADERRRIWELMLPPEVERSGDVDLQGLAASHRFSGGEIRNVALKAIFLAEQEAAPLNQEHLQRAVAIELLELGRISRRPEPMKSASEPPIGIDRGRLLRDSVEALRNALDAWLRPRFLKEIHLVQGSPTEEVLAGKRPAVSLALFRLAGRRGGKGVRAGLIVSTWSHRAEEELELLGVVHEALLQLSLAPVHGRTVVMRVQESHDFELLHRFWSSHDHPVRPSVVVDLEID